MNMFKERRSYLSSCKDCGWDDRLPPYESWNDLCPKCHAELAWDRGDLWSSKHRPPLEADQKQVEVIA